MKPYGLKSRNTWRDEENMYPTTRVTGAARSSADKKRGRRLHKRQARVEGRNQCNSEGT